MFAPSKIKKKFLSLLLLLLSLSTLNAASSDAKLNPKIGVINFKKCVEKSKLGKQEQNSFEALKKQAEKIIQEKEKELTTIQSKLEDSDYIDSLSKEAEAELKHQSKVLYQQLMQQQQQLYQTLNQANFKIVQKITEEVNAASKIVAENLKLDLIFNDESTFYYNSALDVTNETVKILDDRLDQAA